MCNKREKRFKFYQLPKVKFYVKNNFIFRDIAYILYKIGIYWWEFLEKLKFEKRLHIFKQEIINLTLIGDFVGFNFLIKYPKNTIIFHSIVENNSINTRKNIYESFLLFKKYNLYTTHIEMAAKNLKSGENFYKKIGDFIKGSKMSFVQNQEQGSVNILI